VGIAAGLLTVTLAIGSTVAAQGPSDADQAPAWCGACLRGGRAFGEREFVGRGGLTMGWGGVFSGGVLEAIAEEVGVEAEALWTELRSGASLADILDKYGVDVDDLVARVMEQHRAALDEAVASGRISQEQAEYMLEHMEEELAERLSEGELFCGTGGGRLGRSADRQSRQSFGRPSRGRGGMGWSR